MVWVFSFGAVACLAGTSVAVLKGRPGWSLALAAGTNFCVAAALLYHTDLIERMV